MSQSIRLLFGLVLSTTNVFGAKSAENISYHLAWSRPNSHLLEITMTIENLHEDTVEVNLPNWRPGRYVIQNFAKNVVNFSASDGNGAPLPVEKISKSGWRVHTESAGEVVIKYNYYARQLDGGESYLDDTELYVNPITCLMYVPGKEMRPVSMTIDRPPDWQIAIAAEPDSQGAYPFDNYHEIVDTPFLLSPDFETLSFEVKGATIEIVLQGESNYDAEKLTEDIEKIVAEQIDIMRDVPFKRYVFLYHLVPFRIGHGVEHKSSTSIVIGPADFDNEKFYLRFLGVASHELFHAWNVERIRPEAIYYPDYSKENYTTTMWMYEGMTSYYGSLTLVRAGLVKQEKFFENWAKGIQRFQNTYGRKVASASEVSWDSWTKSMGKAPPNTYFSFYDKGAIIGLLLDLEIRHRTRNKESLDDVMRFLNETYAWQNRGVPENGLQMAVEKITGSDFKTFFAHYVHGTTEIDYNRFFHYAGLELSMQVAEKGPQVYWGLEISGDERQTKITNVRPDSPAFAAGLDIGDILLAIDGKRAHKDNLKRVLKKYAPGDTVRVTVFHRSQLRDVGVILSEAKPNEVKLQKKEDTTKAQEKLRKSWLKEREEKK
ncbi:MAG: M61 family metallopeptidase [bacterium]